MTDVILDPSSGGPYIDELRERVMQLIRNQQTIEDVEDRMRKLYPNSQVIELALEEARKPRNDFKTLKSRSHSSYSPGAFGTLSHLTSVAVAHISNLVKSENETDPKVERFKEAFTEFILHEIIHLSQSFVRRQDSCPMITRNDIRTAMHADKDLVDLFLCDDNSLIMTSNHPIFEQLYSTDKQNLTNQNTAKSDMDYKKKVRCMIDYENSFIRGLKLLRKVFKKHLENRYRDDKYMIRAVHRLFCNIEDLYELSSEVMTILEDAMESAIQSDDIPYVGDELFDLAQAEEFHAYFTFTYLRISEASWREAYDCIINRMVSTVQRTNRKQNESSQNIDWAIKHLLPKYLLNIIVHFFRFYDNITELRDLSRKHGKHHDQFALLETISILNGTKFRIEQILRQVGQENLDNLTYKDLEMRQTERESIERDLEKEINSILNQERNTPLPFMPPMEIYRFSEPDSIENIQEETVANEDEKPVIKCATLFKLVERMTYHKFITTDIVDIFLLTYRSFISDPEELLKLLIERYKIPDPPIQVVCPNVNINSSEVDRTTYRHYLRHFRKDYTRPVKMRVINVIKHWIKNYYYDFERHPTLLNDLQLFLDEIYNTDQLFRFQINSIRDLIKKKKTNQKGDKEIMLSEVPPPHEWWKAKADEPDKFDIISLHPTEFARQLTLIEFDLYRAIKPSDLIDDCEFTLRLGRNKTKSEPSPNLRRMTRHFTLFSYWIRKIILEASDLEMRIAIYNRAIQIMGELRKLNNFTGLLSIGSALESAAINRLPLTTNNIWPENKKIIDDYRQLTDSHQKKLEYELRNCNPPCIPYLGSYQTKLLHANEGNKTFIDKDKTPNSPTSPGPRKMINFAKQRIRASLVAELSVYQNTQYCLKEHKAIQNFILNIEDEMIDLATRLGSKPAHNDGGAAIAKTLDDHLYTKSEEIEPRTALKPTKTRTRIPDHLKSPVI